MMGWTVGKPKLEPWPGRKLCCQAGFEFFDHTTTLARASGRLWSSSVQYILCAVRPARSAQGRVCPRTTHKILSNVGTVQRSGLVFLGQADIQEERARSS